MEVTNIVCDVCGRQKGSTNHWLVVVSDPRDPNARLYDGLAFGTIESHVTDALFKVEHICGQACAHTRLSQWLETLTATERQTA